MSFSVHVSISDFLLFVKKGFVVGVRSLKVTVRHSNNVGFSYDYPQTIWPTQFNSPNTHAHTHTVYIELHGSRQGGREAGKKRGRMEGRGDGRAREGGKLQGRYPEEGTGQYIVFTNHPTAWPLPLRLRYK